MLDALQIVKGAVSTKDLVPVLTHIALHEGRICGFDGRVYIDAPAKEAAGLSCTIPAVQFTAAIEACGDTELTMEFKDTSCVIRAGTFTVRLPTGPMENFPRTDLEGAKKAIKTKGLLAAFRTLRPFIGEDASRPWSSGILMMGIKATATNNIVIAEVPLPVMMPTCVVPVFAIDELLRLGLEPTHYAKTPEALIFYLPGDIWLRTKLIAGDWPPAAHTIIREFHGKAKWKKVQPNLMAAVERVMPFCANKSAPIVKLLSNRVSTESETMAAQVTGFENLDNCAFQAGPLVEVLRHASEIDWTLFPRVPFRGPDIGGVIGGAMI